MARRKHLLKLSNDKEYLVHEVPVHVLTDAMRDAAPYLRELRDSPELEASAAADMTYVLSYAVFKRCAAFANDFPTLEAFRDAIYADDMEAIGAALTALNVNQGRETVTLPTEDAEQLDVDCRAKALLAEDPELTVFAALEQAVADAAEARSAGEDGERRLGIDPVDAFRGAGDADAVPAGEPGAGSAVPALHATDPE